jgi:hypothetical protein
VTRVFDGMAGALNRVFGAPVSVRTALSGTRLVQGVFRKEPIEVAQEDGGTILISAPTLRVPQDIAGCIERGSIVEAEGARYVVLNRLVSGSPAADRFVMFELELEL